MLEFVKLGEEGINDLRIESKSFIRELKSPEYGREGLQITRRPSEGSVPAMAPALAAVNDSTSS